MFKLKFACLSLIAFLAIVEYSILILPLKQDKFRLELQIISLEKQKSKAEVSLPLPNQHSISHSDFIISLKKLLPNSFVNKLNDRHVEIVGEASFEKLLYTLKLLSHLKLLLTGLVVIQSEHSPLLNIFMSVCFPCGA